MNFHANNMNHFHQDIPLADAALVDDYIEYDQYDSRYVDEGYDSSNSTDDSDEDEDEEDECDDDACDYCQNRRRRFVDSYWNVRMAKLPDAVEHILQVTPHLMDRREVSRDIRKSLIRRYGCKNLIGGNDERATSGRSRRSMRISGTVIRGMAGIGKTNLAASVIADAKVLRYYRDGVVWLKFGAMQLDDTNDAHEHDDNEQNYHVHDDDDEDDEGSEQQRRQQQYDGKTPLKFTEYRRYLSEISRQLQLPIDDNIILSQSFPQPNILNDIYMNSSSSSNINHSNYAEYVNMNIAKKKMIYKLRHKRVLIVLDDVWRCKDPSWFDFWDENNVERSDYEDGKTHLLVTTRNRNIMPHDEEHLRIIRHSSTDTIDCYYGLIDVPKMNTNESIDLFLKSSQLVDMTDSDTSSIFGDESIRQLKRIVDYAGQRTNNTRL